MVLKYTCFLLVLVWTQVTCIAQEATESKLFTMIYTPGEKWDHTITFDQQPFFKEHSSHLQKLRKEGRIVIGGRYSDKGFMLLKAKDSIEADAVVKMDPSVTHQIFEVALFEFSTFYKGCVERK